MALDDFELDLRDKSEKDIEAGNVVPTGKYHCQVIAIAEDSSKQKGTPGIKFQFRIMAGTVKGQVNRMIFDTVWLTAKDRVLLYAKRLGLLSPADYGKTPRINWLAAKDRQVVVEVEEGDFTREDGTHGKSSKVTFEGIYPVNDSRVAQVPKDMDAITLAGISLTPSATPANGPGATSPAAPAMAGVGATRKPLDI